MEVFQVARRRHRVEDFPPNLRLVSMIGKQEQVDQLGGSYQTGARWRARHEIKLSAGWRMRLRPDVFRLECASGLRASLS